MAKEVVIDEEAMRQKAKKIADDAKVLETKIQKYISILEKVSNNGITDGETAKQLKQYISYCRKLKMQSTIIGQKNQRAIDGFLRDVSEAEKI